MPYSIVCFESFSLYNFLDLPQTTTASTGGRGDQCGSIYCSVGSAAGVAGIVTGVVVAILLVLVFVIFLCCLGRRQIKSQSLIR